MTEVRRPVVETTEATEVAGPEVPTEGFEQAGETSEVLSESRSDQEHLSREVEQETEQLLIGDFSEYLAEHPEVQGLLEEANDIENRMKETMDRVLSLSPNLKNLMAKIALGEATEEQKYEYIQIIQNVSNIPSLQADQEAYEKIFSGLEEKGFLEGIGNWFGDKFSGAGENFLDLKNHANILKGSVATAAIPSVLTFLMSQQTTLGGRLSVSGKVGLWTTAVTFFLMQGVNGDKSLLSAIGNMAESGTRELLVEPADGFSRVVDNAATDFLNLMIGGDANFDKLRAGSINLPFYGEVYGGSAENAQNYARNKYFLERFDSYPMAVQQVLGDYIARGDAALADPTNIGVVAQYVHRAEHLVRPTTSIDQQIVGESLDRQAAPVSFSVRELENLFGTSTAYQQAYEALEQNNAFQPRYTDTVTSSEEFLYGELTLVEAGEQGMNQEYQEALRKPEEVLMSLYEEFSDGENLDWVTDSGRIDNNEQRPEAFVNNIKNWTNNYAENDRVTPQFEKKTLTGYLLKLWAGLTIAFNSILVGRNVISRLLTREPKSQSSASNQPRNNAESTNGASALRSLEASGYAALSGTMITSRVTGEERSYKDDYEAFGRFVRDERNDIVLSESDYERVLAHWQNQNASLTQEAFNQHLGISTEGNEHRWSNLWEMPSGNPSAEYEFPGGWSIEYKDGPREILKRIKNNTPVAADRNNEAFLAEIRNMMQNAQVWCRHPRVVQDYMNGFRSARNKEWYDFNVDTFLDEVKKA